MGNSFNGNGVSSAGGRVVVSGEVRRFGGAVAPLTLEQSTAFYERAGLEPPIKTRTDFQKVGLIASHWRRQVQLDTVVRCWLHDPALDIFADDTVRYCLPIRHFEVFAAVRKIPDLMGHVVRPENHAWVYLLSPICWNCLRPYIEHANQKCLFNSTVWHEMLMPPLTDIPVLAF